MQSFLNLFSGASSSADADAPSAAPSAPALFDEEEAATVAEMRAAAAAQRELERREVELALADEEADEFGFEDAAHAEARWRAIDEANDAAAAPPPLEASSVGAPPPPPPAERVAVSTGGTYRGSRRASEAAAAATAAATSAAYAATSAEVARIQERISALEVLEDAAHNGDESGWSEPLADELQLLRQQLASAVKALGRLAKSSSRPSRLGLTSGASGLSRMGSSFFGR